MRKTRLHLNLCTSSGISARFLPFVLALAFSIAPAYAQTVTVLNDYGITATDGFWPELDALAPGRLGYLHSATCYGGTNNAGAAFKISSTGARTVLHSFNGTDGSCPAGGLALGTDNNLYGTAGGGGTFGDGTIYKMDVAGDVTVLYNFTGGSDGGCVSINKSACKGLKFSGQEIAENPDLKCETWGTQSDFAEAV